MAEWAEICQRTKHAGGLTDELATAAIAVCRGYLRRDGSSAMQVDDIDDVVGVFSTRLTTQWGRVVTSDNPHAYLTRMAENALKDWCRSRSRPIDQTLASVVELSASAVSLADAPVDKLEGAHVPESKASAMQELLRRILEIDHDLEETTKRVAQLRKDRRDALDHALRIASDDQPDLFDAVG